MMGYKTKELPSQAALRQRQEALPYESLEGAYRDLLREKRELEARLDRLLEDNDNDVGC